MNFFEHQEQAERKTFRLVISYLLGLFLTFLAIHAVVTGVVILATDEIRGTNDSQSRSYGSAASDGNRFGDGDAGSYTQGYDLGEAFVQQYLNPELILIDLTLVILIIGGGTLYKTSQLRRMDGDGIAQMYGGVRVQQRGASWKEKRLLNIVEEMAIASGIHVPNVYVLRNESGINAFAAGYSEPTSAVAVTQGALDYLSRDELEGVIAHEFSHILHHDTRLNMRLIGILFGLEMIAIIGYVILRSTPNVTVSRSGVEGKGRIGVLILLIGLGLLVIGLLGQLFANIIRAAVSRQREFLADASAVQYTRNPEGITGALKKIGSRVGARVTNSKAVEGSHLFFGNIFDGSFLSGIFNSHPDLTERIRRIDPKFDGRYPETIGRQVNPEAPEPEPAPKADSGENLKKVLDRAMGEFGRHAFGAGSAAVVSAILGAAGNVTREKIAVAKALLENIPPAVEEKINDRFGATAALLAVLLDSAPQRREQELAYLRENLSIDVLENIGTIAKELEGVTDAVKIPIVQKAFPHLRTMPKSDYLRLREIILTLMKSDGQIDLLEFTIAGFVINDLDLYFRLVPAPVETLEEPDQIADPFFRVASMLAYAGTDDRAAAQKAFVTAVESLGLPRSPMPNEACTPAEFSQALNTLSHAKAPLRQKVLEALYALISADGQITEREGELIRAVTAYLNCPMPTWGE
ncbi:MAG: M48 family metallopeptidase [Thermoguttaceae bacterium]|nr:M48 family metallopeptidase [Thermoguttaceae bacterium]